MGFENRYCSRCKMITDHTKKKEDGGFARIFMGLVTAGFSELMNDTLYMCTRCELKTKKDPVTGYVTCR